MENRIVQVQYKYINITYNIINHYEQCILYLDLFINIYHICILLTHSILSKSCGYSSYLGILKLFSENYIVVIIFNHVELCVLFYLQIEMSNILDLICNLNSSLLHINTFCLIYFSLQSSIYRLFYSNVFLTILDGYVYYGNFYSSHQISLKVWNHFFFCLVVS